MKKLLPNKKYLIKLIAWALTIVILLPSMIVIGIYTFYPFKIPSDVIPNPLEQPLVYPRQTHNDFKTSLYNFFKIGIFPLGDVTITQLAEFFITAFSRARIPKEKVETFGQNLENNGDQVALYMERLLDYLDNKETGLTLKEDIDALVFYNELVGIATAVIQLFIDSGFTEDEIGKVLYEFLFQVPNTEYHNALLELGKNGFATIYKSVYAALSLSEIDFGAGYTEQDLRQMRSALAQMGYDYIKVYNALGNSAIETIIGTKFLILSEDTDEITPDEIHSYNQAIQSLDGLFSFSLLVFSEFSLKTTNGFFANVAEYAKAENKAYLILYALQGARYASSALQSAYNNIANDKIKNKQDLISAYANAYKESRNLISKIKNQEIYDVNHTQDIKDYLDNVDYLAENYANITTIQDIDNLTEQERKELLEKIALLSQIDKQVQDTPQELVGILLVNILFKVIDLQGFLAQIATQQLPEGLG